MVDDADLLTPSDLGKKLIVALRSVTDTQALMQAVADRSCAALSRELTARLDAMEQATSLWHDDLVRVPTDVQKAITGTEAIFEARLATLRAVDDHSTQERQLILGHVTENLRSAREYLQSELVGNKQLYLEKFTAIEDTITVLKDTINDRFTQNDQNTEKAFNAAKTAVGEQNASNTASAAKSENNLTKLIESLNDSIKTLSETTDKRIEQNKSNTDDKIENLKEQVARLDNRISSGDAGKKSGGEAVLWMFGVATFVSTLLTIGTIIFTLSRHT